MFEFLVCIAKQVQFTFLEQTAVEHGITAQAKNKQV